MPTLASSLPSLHPAVVHFPIALLSLAPVVDLVALVFRRRAWIAWAGTVLWVLAALGVGAAYLSGEDAEETAAITGADAMVALEAHEESAERLLITVIAVALARLVLTFVELRRQRASGPGAAHRPGIWAPLTTLVVSPIVVFLVARTADLGGHLIYTHGVGVSGAGEELIPADRPKPD